MMETKMNMKKNMIWNGAGNLIYMVCQWLVTVLVTRIGDFADAGLLSIAMSVSTTFQTLAMFGIRNFQVSDTDGKYTDSTYVSFRTLTCLGALMTCMVFSLIADYRGEALLAIFLFMLFRLAENFSDVLHGIAQKNGRLDIAGKSFAIKGVGLLAAFLVGYMATHALCVAIGLMALVSCLSTLIYDIPTVRCLSTYTLLPRREHRIFSLARETLPLCIYLFLNVAIMTVPKLILERCCGEELLGAYSSIFAPALLIQAVMGYIYTPFATIFAEQRAKGDRLGFLKLFFKLSAVIAVLTAIMLPATYFLGETLLGLIFTEKILPYVSYLIPILIGIALAAFFSFLCMLATVLRSFVWLIVSCLVALVAELLLTAPWINLVGVNATSYSLILAMALASLILLVGVLLRIFSKPEKGETDGTNQ